MSEHARARWRGALFAAGVITYSSICAPVHAVGVGGYSSSRGATGTPFAGSSVIRHGDTGFSIYNRQGVTRVIGGPPSRGSVTLPDGRRAKLIGDGRGGAYLLGAPGNHWISGPNTYRFSPRRRLSGDGP